MNKITVLTMVLISFMGVKTVKASPTFPKYGFTIPSNFSSDHIPTVPTNFGGLLWSPCYTCIDGNLSKFAALYRVGDHEVMVPTSMKVWDKNQDSYLVYLISPMEELEPGVLYELRMNYMCGYNDIPFAPVRFITSQSFKYPTLLGEIKEFPARFDSVSAGSPCLPTTEFGAEKNFELAVSPEFAPWMETAYISAFIDGYLWHEITQVSVEDGSLKISAYFSQSCERAVQKESKHKIKFQAKLPNTDLVLETPTLEFAILCPSDIDIVKAKNSIPAAMGPITDTTNNPEGMGCQSTDADHWVSVFLILIVTLLRKTRFQRFIKPKPNISG